MTVDIREGIVQREISKRGYGPHATVGIRVVWVHEVAHERRVRAESAELNRRLIVQKPSAAFELQPHNSRQTVSAMRLPYCDLTHLVLDFPAYSRT